MFIFTRKIKMISIGNPDTEPGGTQILQIESSSTLFNQYLRESFYQFPGLAYFKSFILESISILTKATLSITVFLEFGRNTQNTIQDVIFVSSGLHGTQKNCYLFNLSDFIMPFLLNKTFIWSLIYNIQKIYLSFETILNFKNFQEYFLNKDSKNHAI